MSPRNCDRPQPTPAERPPAKSPAGGDDRGGAQHGEQRGQPGNGVWRRSSRTPRRSPPARPSATTRGDGRRRQRPPERRRAARRAPNSHARVGVEKYATAGSAPVARTEQQDERGPRARRRARRRPAADAAAAERRRTATPGPEQDRPDEVELLLDRERPEVLDRRRHVVGGEVVDGVGGQLPVLHVAAPRRDSGRTASTRSAGTARRPTALTARTSSDAGSRRRIRRAQNGSARSRPVAAARAGGGR